MADISRVKQKSDAANRPSWQKTPMPEAPYMNKKTAGESITFVPLTTSIAKFYTFRRPVYNEKKEKPETVAMQNLNVRWIGQANKYGDPGNKLNSWNYPQGFFPPPAEEAMLKLSVFALQQYREYVVENKVKHGAKRDEATVASWDITFRDGNMPFWSNDKLKYGITKALIGNEIVPFTLYKETFDPTEGNGYYSDAKKIVDKVKALSKSAFLPRAAEEIADLAVRLFGNRYTHNTLRAAKTLDNLLGILAPVDSVSLLLEYNKGIKQLFEETHKIDGKEFFKYPKYLTTFQIIAQNAQEKAFGKDRIVWKPVPQIHSDYQKLVPAEFGDYVLVHPDDVDVVRGYLASASNWQHPVPAFREHPDVETGQFQFVSLHNPDLVSPLVSVYDGALGDVFSKILVESWSKTPEFFGFEPATQETLVGGFYYEHPEVEFEFQAMLEKEKRTIKAKAERKRIYGVTIKDFKDVVLTDNKPSIRTEHGFATLEWATGHLWEKPLNLNRMTEDGNLAFGNDAVITKIKAEADKLGVPYRGKETPKPYWPLKDHPQYKEFLAYAESKGQKVDDSSEDSAAETSDGSKAKDIDV